MKRALTLLLTLAMFVSLFAVGGIQAFAAKDVEMQYMTADETEAVLGTDGYTVVDLRKVADFEEAHIPGAVSVDMSAAVEGDAAAGEAAVKAAFEGVDDTLILVCYSGKKYAQAGTNALAAVGYDMSKVFTLKDGFNGWKETKAELTESGAAAAAEVPETTLVRWNYGTSGNVLVTVALEKGYFKEYGIDLEIVEATQNAGAMQLLSSGKVDIVSNAGTSNPLQQIASGVDMTIFGGHMVTGCMPVIAKKGTEWNGVESLLGKKFACNPSYFAFTGAVMELGYDKPLEALDWQVFTSYDDALAAVVRGEVDYALMGTGQNYAVKNRDDVEIVTYQSEVMPNYSCCRMEALTEFVENNPVTLKCIMKALLRAQAYYEANRDECVTLLANTIGATEEYVAAYMLDDAHYVVNVDPLHNSVVRAWGILDATGFLDENAKNINIEDHINTTLYQEALAEATAEFGSEAPDFYAKQLTFFNENNL